MCSLLVFTFILGEFLKPVRAANETIFDSYTEDIVSLETGEVTGTNTFDTKRKVKYLKDNLIEISQMNSGNYAIQSYEYISNRTSLNGLMMDPGSQAGNRKVGVANNGSTKLAAFKAYANNVYKARMDQIQYGVELVVVLGVVALTWATFWTALLGVGRAAMLANQMWTNWSWADQNVRNAYKLI